MSARQKILQRISCFASSKEPKISLNELFRISPTTKEVLRANVR